MFITLIFLTQRSKRLCLPFPKITLACWSTRERMNPDSFKTSFWVFFLCLISIRLILSHQSHSFCEIVCLPLHVLWELTCYILLTDLKPKGVVVSMIPSLAAHILFMCIRHADYLNDEAKLKSLMSATISAVKKVITVRINLSLIAFISTIDLLDK